MGTVSFQKNNGEAYFPMSDLEKYDGKNLSHIDLIFRPLASVEGMTLSKGIRYVIGVDAEALGVSVKEFCCTCQKRFGVSNCFISYTASGKVGMPENTLVGIEPISIAFSVDGEDSYDYNFYFVVNTGQGLKRRPYEVAVVGFRNLELA